MDIQAAQDSIQAAGVFYSTSVDATGRGRAQVWDWNWIVVDQSPRAGATIDEGDAVLSVVKEDEFNGCQTKEQDALRAAAHDRSETLRVPVLPSAPSPTLPGRHTPIDRLGQHL